MMNAAVQSSHAFLVVLRCRTKIANRLACPSSARVHRGFLQTPFEVVFLIVPDTAHRRPSCGRTDAFQSQGFQPLFQATARQRGVPGCAVWSILTVSRERTRPNPQVALVFGDFADAPCACYRDTGLIEKGSVRYGNAQHSLR
jgi:hypothetical protein